MAHSHWSKRKKLIHQPHSAYSQILFLFCLFVYNLYCLKLLSSFFYCFEFLSIFAQFKGILLIISVCVYIYMCICHVYMIYIPNMTYLYMFLSMSHDKFSKHFFLVVILPILTHGFQR